jgi:hypothetical protein
MSKGVRRGVIPPPYEGLDYSDFSVDASQTKVIQMENMHLDSSGTAYSRLGTKIVNSSALDDEITNIFQYNRPFGSTLVRTILVATKSSWYKYNNDGTFTKIATLSSTDRPSVVSFLDGSGNTIAILANGSDFLKYDGSADTVSNLVSLGAFSGTSFPRYLTVYDNRLMAAGCDNEPTRVFASNLLDPTAWDANDFFKIDHDSDSERITGLATVWSFLIITKLRSINLVTEGDPTSTTVKSFAVARGFGAISHWAIQTVGNDLYFLNRDSFYVGRLREAVDNGMEVLDIGSFVNRKFADLEDFSDVTSVYDPEHKEIIWGFKQTSEAFANFAIVLSTELTGMGQNGYRPVWSGFFKSDGLKTYTLGRIYDSTSGQEQIWSGSENGYISFWYQDNYRQDQMSDGAGGTIDKNITFLITTGIYYPYGLSRKKRFCNIFPSIYQRYDGSISLTYTVNYIEAFEYDNVDYSGDIPYWNSTGTDPEWDSTTWAQNPMIPKKITLNVTGNLISFRISSTSENNNEIAYRGFEIYYQVLSQMGVV